MSKILFFLLIFFAIYLGWRSFRIKQIDSKKKEQASKQDFVMVSCARCGIYVPQSEAYENNGQYYCCKEHCHSNQGKDQ